MTLWKSLVSTLSGDDARRSGKTDSKAPLTPNDFRPRQRLKEGFLWSEGMIRPRPITIRDMSPLTAKIVLWQDDLKPNLLTGALKLYSSADRKEVDCVIAGREGNVISLKLMSALREPTRKYA